MDTLTERSGKRELRPIIDLNVYVSKRPGCVMHIYGFQHDGVALLETDSSNSLRRSRSCSSCTPPEVCVVIASCKIAALSDRDRHAFYGAQ